jgi:ketosteroid isomerase-like protein
MKVNMISPNVAVVTGIWSGAGTDAKGQKFDTTDRWTDVFVNQNGKWKCVASQKHDDEAAPLCDSLFVENDHATCSW